MRQESGVPLYTTSAEPFESLYSVVRRSYHSGTRNVPKQVLENGFLRIKYVLHNLLCKAYLMRRLTLSFT